MSTNSITGKFKKGKQSAEQKSTKSWKFENCLPIEPRRLVSRLAWRELGRLTVTLVTPSEFSLVTIFVFDWYLEATASWAFCSFDKASKAASKPLRAQPTTEPLVVLEECLDLFVAAKVWLVFWHPEICLDLIRTSSWELWCEAVFFNPLVMLNFPPLVTIRENHL